MRLEKVKLPQLLFCLLVAACGQADKVPPKTISEAAGEGSEIALNYGDLLITSTLPATPKDVEYVSELAVLARNLALAIQANAPDLPASATTVSILALTPDLDRLGNPGSHSFATVTFQTVDLREAHVDRLGAYGVLDLATEVHPVLPWQLAIGTWCTQHDRAQNFCMMSRRSIGDDVPWNGPEY